MRVSGNRQQSSSGKDRSRRDAAYYCVMKSPVGKLLLAGTAQALTQISFQDGRHPIKPDRRWIYSELPFRQPIRQLKEYFSGKRKTFKIRLAPKGTPFQLKVWQALRTIPYGHTTSYGQIAKAIGNPRAARAIGAANGRNPLSIIVPCHRVIGSNGKLVGYGGGLSIKEALLTHETHCPPARNRHLRVLSRRKTFANGLTGKARVPSTPLLLLGVLSFENRLNPGR